MAAFSRTAAPASRHDTTCQAKLKHRRIANEDWVTCINAKDGQTMKFGRTLRRVTPPLDPRRGVPDKDIRAYLTQALAMKQTTSQTLPSNRKRRWWPDAGTWRSLARWALDVEAVAMRCGAGRAQILNYDGMWFDFEEYGGVSLWPLSLSQPP